MYYYWIQNKLTGETDNFIDDTFYDIGTEIPLRGETYVVTDIAAAEAKVVTCEDLKGWY